MLRSKKGRASRATKAEKEGGTVGGSTATGREAANRGESRCEYIGRRSERLACIAERAKRAHGLTQAEVPQLQYQGREGPMLAHKRSGVK